MPPCESCEAETESHQAESPELLGCLFDLVRIALDVAIDIPIGHGVEFVRQLRRVGFLTGASNPSQCLGRPLDVGPFGVALGDGARAEVRGRLYLAVTRSGHLRLTSRSDVAFNLMRPLRAVVPRPGPAGLDGHDNVLGPSGPEWPALLGLQLDHTARIIDSVLSVLSEAAGCPRSRMAGHLLVRWVEVLRDLHQPDAEAAVRGLRRMGNPAAAWTGERTFADRAGGRVSVAFRERAAHAPEVKCYAKRRDLLRLEVAARQRRSVRALLARRLASQMRSGLDGADASRMLADCARAAAPMLDRMEAALSRAEAAAPASAAGLVLGFAPLVRLAAPERRAAGAGGRPAGDDLRDRARRAIDDLVEFGSFDAAGLGTRDALLLALREMADAGALLAPEPGMRVFAAAPELELARRLFSAPEARPAGRADGCATAGAGAAARCR